MVNLRCLYLIHKSHKHFKSITCRRNHTKLIIYVLLLLRVKISIRERNKLHSRALLFNVSASPWYTLYEYGSDEDLIAVVTLSRDSFELLLKEFKKHYKMYSGAGRVGRPPRVRDHHCVLAVLLHSFCSEAESKTWQEMFGVAPSTISRLFQRGWESLQQALNNLPEASIKWPTHEEQHYMAALVEKKEPLMKGRWGFVDGKNYRVEESGNSSIQNSQYNGWLHDVFVTGIACFTASGLVCYAKLNYFGSWNDGEMSIGFRAKLANPHKNIPGHGVVSDTAFPVSNQMFGRILTPLKDGDIERSPPHLRGILSRISAVM